uniref:protoporphyrinogen oxidase HemJ n=1 Tax=Pararhizobium sp. IMCC3301 TaxID=3067904 RepID=UPI0027425CFE|nr:protoporphyrinogen oxidase HemJ [Pararhizobium sp. IMCC3301]
MYLWLKAFHILAVISWMATLLYLPRLMVYHCSAAAGSEQSETFKIMQRRLLRGIGTPAMLVSWALGLYLIGAGGYLGDGTYWLHGKLLLVILMSAVHFRLAWHVKQFASDQNRHSERYFRIINEVPAVIMVGIVILVVVKPF